MFFDEGWVPMAEATAEVFRKLQELKDAGKIHESHKGLSSLLAISVWDICDASIKVGATLSNGVMITASKELVAWADPTALSNEHIDVRVGTIGSATMPDDSGTLADAETLTQRYGPFLGLPIVVPENNFKSSLTFLEEEAAKPAHDDEIVQAARKLLGMVKAEQLVTREIARNKLGATLSRRKLKIAWAMAAKHAPDLTKPNRWVGL